MENCRIKYPMEKRGQLEITAVIIIILTTLGIGITALFNSSPLYLGNSNTNEYFNYNQCKLKLKIQVIMLLKVVYKMENEDNKKTRTYASEWIINFALVYSVFISIILFPYLILRGFFGSSIFLWVVVGYLIFVIIYVIFWIMDKKDFFKDEITS